MQTPEEEMLPPFLLATANSISVALANALAMVGFVSCATTVERAPQVERQFPLTAANVSIGSGWHERLQQFPICQPALWLL